MIKILDGWVLAIEGKDDVIFNTPTAYFGIVWLANLSATLTCRPAVRTLVCPNGPMGNLRSRTLGIPVQIYAVYQDLRKVDRRVPTTA